MIQILFQVICEQKRGCNGFDQWLAECLPKVLLSILAFVTQEGQLGE